MLVRLAALSAFVAAAHAALVLSDGKLQLIDSVAAAPSASTTFTSDAPAPLSGPANSGPLQLAPTDHLKLAFALKDDQGNPVQPHQAALVWAPVDPEEQAQYGRDHVDWLKVNRRSGKAKWDLDLARAPSSLLSLTKGPLSLTLLLSAPSHAPLSLSLGSFLLPASLTETLSFPFPPVEDLPKGWEAEKYAEQTTLRWTFREGEKRVGWAKAAVGTAVVGSPWVVFLGMLLPLLPSLRLRAPSPLSTTFLALLLTLELSFTLFWLDRLPFASNLLQALPVFGGLAITAAGVGRGVLGEMQRRRMAGGKKLE
ncbi:hypothetical protein JCM8097_002501 [Rhodosporidiobolus ruineniae]